MAVRQPYPALSWDRRAKPKLEPAWKKSWTFDAGGVTTWPGFDARSFRRVRLMIDDMAAETAERMSLRTDKPAVTQIPSCWSFCGASTKPPTSRT